MDYTTHMTGTLWMGLIIAAVLASVASPALLRLYRKATLKAMAQATGVEPEIESRAAVTVQDPAPLRVETVSSASPMMASGAAYRRSAESVRQAAKVYALGGAGYALVMTIPWTVAGGGFSLGRFMWLFVCFVWPIVLTTGLVAITGSRARLRLLAGYVALVMLVVIYVLIRNPESSMGQLIFYWCFINAPATLLLLAFLRRKVRAVGPMVLAFTVAGVLGAFAAIAIVQGDDKALGAIVSVGDLLGFNAVAIFLLLLAIGFLTVGGLGWRFLGKIGAWYRAKRLSDQSITVDSIWLLFAVVQPITLTFEHPAWYFFGLAGFVVYKAVTRAGFERLRAKEPDTTAPVNLLLLRVFALGDRSQQIFDAVSKWWRQAGTISLIAGPDLVTSNVEPHEFLEFIGGRLSRRFVQDEADLERRIAEIDQQRDPDGRFRVTEFFCHADTWKMTMRRLAEDSTSILMDLRSFSGTNQGCIYEIEQLLNIVDLERVVFLVDDTTDATFLRDTMMQLWGRMDASSPNLLAESPTARLIEASTASERPHESMLIRLMNKGDASQGAPSTSH